MKRNPCCKIKNTIVLDNRVLRESDIKIVRKRKCKTCGKILISSEELV